MNDYRNSDEFIKNFRCIINQVCWGVAAGEGSGSIISLDFGKKIPYKQPLKNKHLSDDQRKFKGEYSILITCSWRLDSPEKVICSSKNSNQNNGPMVKGLKKIIDKKVALLDIIKPSYDVAIHFQDGYALKIFCDETNVEIEEKFDNYSFYTPNYIYSVLNRSKLLIKKRNSNLIYISPAEKL